jgi:hypothetical protein
VSLYTGQFFPGVKVQIATNWQFAVAFQFGVQDAIVFTRLYLDEAVHFPEPLPTRASLTGLCEVPEQGHVEVIGMLLVL